MSKSLILGIGLNKTGTSSLTNALYDLGIPCLHSAKAVKKIIGANERAGRPLLHPLDEKWPAFCDSPIPYIFKQLDADYPGSRFILTVRDVEPWVISRISQFGGTPEHQQQVWEKHMRAVAEHFEGRANDLLIYDLCGGDGWEPLCRFLGKPVPTHEFPWKNKTGTKRWRRVAAAVESGMPIRPRAFKRIRKTVKPHHKKGK
jgi:hypothetical protein